MSLAPAFDEVVVLAVAERTDAHDLVLTARGEAAEAVQREADPLPDLELRLRHSASPSVWPASSCARADSPARRWPARCCRGRSCGAAPRAVGCGRSGPRARISAGASSRSDP